MSHPLPSIGGPSFRGVIGVAREDISPPAGIYSRCWAAAEHNVATGLHRPLTLTCITFQAAAGAPPLVLMALDLMTWRSRDDEWSVRGHVLKALGLPADRLMMCLSHTHASPAVQSVYATKPGGHLIAPYLRRLRDAATAAAERSLSSARPATLTWRYGRCDLATNRDLADPSADRVVCGYNPAAAADDALLVGRVTDSAGVTLATVVNYACHPTTLAWANTLISPDYVGAMRETVEGHTAAPCLFLQGASGELAPAEQYVADPSVADRHGRQLAFAALSTFEAMGSGATALAYDRVVESGAPLAVWGRRPAVASSEVSAEIVWTDLPLKECGPTAAELEAQWSAAADPVAKERLARRRAIRQIVGDGPASRMPLWAWRIGDSVLLGQPNEAYSALQTQVRRARPGLPIAVMNLVNGSGGYLPPDGTYESDRYQVSHTPFAAGSLERLIAAAEGFLNVPPAVDSRSSSSLPAGDSPCPT